MPCENVSSCNDTISSYGTTLVVVVTSPTGVSSNQTGDSTRRDDGGDDHPVSLDRAEVIFTLCLSLLTIGGNLLALFLTKFAGGGQSPTMVFVRMLCVADFFVGCYGAGKMVMFLFVDSLIINFFLPESLFFTATTASCLSLLLLNVDRGLKVSAPFWYAQSVDKPSIITGMVYLWNVSFVLGFLPLLGWNSSQKRFVLGLFSFLPWHYLLVMGLLWLLCVSGSVAVLAFVWRRVDLAPRDHRYLTSHWTEVEKYCKLRVTIALDIVTWTLCYVPFLVFAGLACGVCPLAGRVELGRSVYHFVPVFMLRSLAGAGVQVYRTVHVQGLGKLQHGSRSITSPGRRRHHRHRFHKRSFEENGVATISYSNPMCETESGVTDASTLDDSVTISVPSTLLESVRSSNEDDPEGGGISNPAYRPSIQMDLAQGVCGVTEENTAL